ncbi:Rrf2 family transcriptional regulator [Pikeienuella piscinae]|uniref:Rrf2 family transcriptional regulator n=1 Tax=Pikeienuella piscinae TaxID=2748098 RepID=A0A7L5BY92_9RHOB|nr:Rrf2 family transcriptional regulator [Pikeienuella piscinae]QIE56421.1 Rrf2 family transcriptional regulator [Pikeienuella piscinae]
MLKFSRKTLFAFEAVLDIAYNARPDPVQSKDINRRLGIPQRYLEQVMQQLVREGVLKGVRGPRGGYTLARERRRITVAEIVRIVDAAENDGDEAPASALGEKVARPLWLNAQEAVLRELESVTMQDLCAEAEAQGVKRAGAVPDFSI